MNICPVDKVDRPSQTTIHYSTKTNITLEVLNKKIQGLRTDKGKRDNRFRGLPQRS